MIKIYTLNNISDNSSEALYKICLNFDSYGLTDEDVFQAGEYEEIFEAIKTDLSAGDFVIIGVEKNDYLRFKYEFIQYHAFMEDVDSRLKNIISERYYQMDKATIEAQSLVPYEANVHRSDDGLYSGFSVELDNGLCTVLPLDFARLDNIIRDFIGSYIDESVLPGGEVPFEDRPVPEDEDFEKISQEAISKMIYSLVQVDKTIAFANSEAAYYIYNLYDKIQGLSEAISFVEIVDPEYHETEDVGEVEPKPFVPTGDPQFVPRLDEFGEPIFDDDGNIVYDTIYPDAPADEATFKAELPKETPSAKTIRHAREAMRNMRASFGAAVSDVFSTIDEESGKQMFFSFIAIADGKTVKAKKIGTDNPEEAENLMYHAITVLCDTVCKKIDAIKTSQDEAKRQQKENAAPSLTDGLPLQKKNEKVNPAVIAVIALVFVVAILSAVLFAKGLIEKDKVTTTLPPLTMSTDAASNTNVSVSDTQPGTTQGIPGLSDPVLTIPGGANDNPLAPAEPTASNVSAPETSAMTPSTSGKFTFYVFGYGHGVGLSQTGATYYAEKNGWNYAQILANYFYGTTLMSGDTYPQKITYNGTQYNTREFLAGALEGEMGDSNAVEALRAQAVAIYTFAKYYNFNLQSSAMAYKPSPSAKCYEAVDFIIKNGLYIAYAGQTALTPFHATSAGLTTSYYNVWGGTALTYLAGGRPSYGDYEAKDFKTTVEMTSDELKTLVEGADSSIKLSGDPSTWISVLSHDACVNGNIGYVSTIRVGGKEMSGNDFRTKIMGSKLRSHCFMMTYTPN